MEVELELVGRFIHLKLLELGVDEGVPFSVGHDDVTLAEKKEGPSEGNGFKDDVE